MHNEYGKEALRFLDARIGHLHEDLGVLMEVYHQLLLFLHLSKAILVDDMRVVKEEVIL